jgi:hypothetical protein
MARTVKFLGRQERNDTAPVGEPLAEGYEDDALTF